MLYVSNVDRCVGNWINLTMIGHKRRTEVLWQHRPKFDPLKKDANDVTEHHPKIYPYTPFVFHSNVRSYDMRLGPCAKLLKRSRPTITNNHPKVLFPRGLRCLSSSISGRQWSTLLAKNLAEAIEVRLHDFACKINTKTVIRLLGLSQ